MNRIYQFLTFSLISLLGTSCLPDNLLIDVAPAEPQLVIASQILPGDLLVVFVSRSFSALEGREDSLSDDFLDQILVESALTTVTINGQVDTLLPIEDAAGVYISGFGLPIDEGEVRLDVYDSLTRKSVHATTMALPPIALDTANFEEIMVQGDTIHQISYTFSDPVDEENWYVLNVFDPAAYASAISANPLQLVGGDEGVQYETLISDQIFSTPTYSDQLQLDSRALSDTLGFFFANISEGYYRFLDARQRSNGLIASATSEPINFPSNVIGGLGYFAIQAPTLRLVPKMRR